MLHLDIPSLDQFRRLSAIRADACVSLYLPTSPLSQAAGASRIELANLLRQAIEQLQESGFDKRRLAALREQVEDLLDDDGFWEVQARSLAVLATSEHIETFRLANALPAMVAVSQRFHLKPLLRAITFAHTAFILALSENAVRLLQILPEGPPVDVRLADLPADAASAAGRASINERSPSGRIQGAEGKKVRLTQYARKVDAALRPLLAGDRTPLFLAANEPLAAIFRAVSSLPGLAPTTIPGGTDRATDAELAAAARPLLDALYADQLAAFRALFAARAEAGRGITDIADAGRAAAQGAIDSMLVDIDRVVDGTFDEASGRITLADAPSAETYGVVDAIAARALATGATVLAVRAGDIAGGGALAAILRYAA